MNGLGSLLGLAATTAEQTQGIISSISNAIAQDAPIIQGKVAPPGWVLDPKTGKFVPSGTTTPSAASGGSGFGSVNKYIPYIIGGVVVIGFGYMMFGKKRKR